MRQLKFSIIILVLAALASCKNRGNTIITSSDGETVEVHYNGDIHFNDSETAIESISPYGFIKYRKNDHEFEAESNSHGQVEYKFYNDGREISLDQKDRERFLAMAIQDLISYGFDSKNRFDKIYARGGSAAVLTEVDKLKGDYIKGVYLEYLLDGPKIDQADLTEIAKKIATSLGSDFDKQRLLNKFPVITDSATGFAYFRAVKTIGSDFDRASAIRHLYDQPLSDNLGQLILLAVKTLGSDFEKSQLLGQYPSRYLQDSLLTDTYLDAVRSIGSDFEKANAIRNLFHQRLSSGQIQQILYVANTLGSDFEKANILKEMIEKENLDSAVFNTMLNVSGSVGSDFEKANIIRELMRKKIYPGDSFNNLISAVNHVNSDYERTNLLKELADKNIQTDAQWIALINACEQIQSSFDKANLLVNLAGKMPKNETVRGAYLKIAKTIPEDAEYGRVVKAVD